MLTRFFTRALLSPVLCVNLGATIVPRLTLEQLVKRADKIVQARVVKSWTAWDPGHEFIWTHYQLNIIDILKGSPKGTPGVVGGVADVVVSEVGGIVGDRSLSIAGTPRFRTGEELILFLYRTPLGYWRTVGYGQGRFRVEGGRVHAGESGDVPGLDLLPLPENAPGTPLAKLDGLSTAEFKTRVRTIVNRQKAGDTE